MGTCYSVRMKLTLLDEVGAIKALNEHMARDTKTHYNLAFYEEQGITPDTVDGLMKILLAEPQSEVSIRQAGKTRYYENAFNASYGWESVMMDWFNVLTPFLNSGSQMVIYPESDYDKLVVKNGKCVQVH